MGLAGAYCKYQNANYRLAICVLQFAVFFFLDSAPARADGGSVLLSEITDHYRITVFSAPSPFRAGPVDISVFVQDGVTGQPVPQALVIVRMTQMGQPALEYPATQDIATNKLLKAAEFELPTPGRWELEVQVEDGQGTALVACEVDAAERVPPWHSLWPWIAWPILPIALFSIHELSRRKAVRPAAVRLSGGRGYG